MTQERIPETSDLRIVFRGYDVDQVNELVARLVDGGEAADVPASLASTGRSAIERIAEKSKSILMAAHESAEQLRLEAEAHAGEAEAHAQKVRSEANAYAERGSRRRPRRGLPSSPARPRRGPRRRSRTRNWRRSGSCGQHTPTSSTSSR